MIYHLANTTISFSWGRWFESNWGSQKSRSRKWAGFLLLTSSFLLNNKFDTGFLGSNK